MLRTSELWLKTHSLLRSDKVLIIIFPFYLRGSSRVLITKDRVNCPKLFRTVAEWKRHLSELEFNKELGHLALKF